MRQEFLQGPARVRFWPSHPSGVGVLTLAGSSGRIDADRARVFAEVGAVAESIQWFGGPGQNAGPWEVPIEMFLQRVEALGRECDRVVVCGTSFGAEAALLTGAHSPQVDTVIGFAPSDVVWGIVTPDGRTTSHWTLAGKALPYVELSAGWQPDVSPPAYVGLYEQSFRDAGEATVSSAAIPVERINELVLVAGEDDQVWPSRAHAERIASRRKHHGRSTTLVLGQDAGHRTVLPGESVVGAGMTMARGGTQERDRELGQRVMPYVRRLLGLAEPCQC